MSVYYSKSTGGFFSRDIHGDGMPHDVVEITDAYHSELMQGQQAGLCIVTDADGYPTLEPAQPSMITESDIERLRLTAYADPITGSDRYFNEATRMQLMGEAGWEAVKAEGVVRYQAIQQQFPWPLADNK